MQNQYFGDVGDYVKYGLLRALRSGFGEGVKLGVLWYMTADGVGNATDGKHDDYLDEPGPYRALDPDLFDCLHLARRRQPARRDVRVIEESGLLGEARFFGDIVPPSVAGRRAWFESAARHVAGADLVFVDPDNGLEPNSPTEKHVLWSELRALLDAPHPRTVIVYQHQNRTKRPETAHFPAWHLDECVRRLLPSGARPIGVHSRRGSVRAFLHIAHTAHEAIVRRSLDGFVATWGHGNARKRLLEQAIVSPGAISGVRTSAAPAAASRPKRTATTRMVVCKLLDREIGVEEALALRDREGTREFRCVGCGVPVIAHRGGSDGQEHFEHRPKNEHCPAR